MKQRAWLCRITLLLILLVGGYFRTLSLLTWDGGTGQHPDERFFADVTSLIRLPTSVSNYFDSAHSPANPRNVGKDYFTYGTFPPLLTRMVAVMMTLPDQLPETNPAIGHIASHPNHERTFPRFPEPIRALLNPARENMTTYANIYRVGRGLSVLFDLGTIVITYLIGRRLFGRRVGLLAAALLALAVFHIQQAHFYQDPTFSTFFTALALYWAVRGAQAPKGGWISFAVLGLSIGAAMGNRITLVALVIVAIVAAILTTVAHQEYRKRSSASGNGTSPFAMLFAERGLPLLILTGVTTILGFRLVQPYAFIGSPTPSAPLPSQQATALDFMEGWGFFDLRLDPRYVENMDRIKRYTTGESDWPPALQWVNRTPYWFPLQNIILWGMGIPAGVAAWIGWTVAGVEFFRMAISGRKASPQQKPVLAALILWLWVAVYFGWMGGQFTLYLRYMLPISVPLTIFAAWLLFRPASAWSASVVGSSRSASAIARLVPGSLLMRIALMVVLIGTFAWAYAFTRIYTREHSRITAARWLLDHAPAGSTIAHESWDDPLPFGIDPIREQQKGFRSLTMHLYAEDEPTKYYGQAGEPGLLQNLERADYITLTSNRVYDSVRRSPMRYPVSMRYYHYLFSGELGFELVADITSYPTLFTFTIPDQGADEAFSVYDHPRTLIFRKTPLFSRDRAESLITGDVMWDEVYRIPVKLAHLAPTALRLTEDEWPRYRRGGTWSEMFHRQSLVNAIAPLVWLGVLELIGLATFGLLFRLFPWLPDRGFSLSRALGLLVVAWSAWMLGSGGILAFSPLSVWVCAIPLLVVGMGWGWQSRQAILAFWRERCAALVTAQAIYLGAFAFLLIIRWMNPDLWHPARGGEKMMEMAYLNAILKSAKFPPYDPWFAGGYINYYYFGFVIVGTLIHLTTIVPSIGFNLAVPTIFALTAVGAWGVVYNLLASRPRKRRDGQAPTPTLNPHQVPSFCLPTHPREVWASVAAMLAPVLVLLTGNLAQPLWYLNGYAAQQVHRPEWAYWDATRIVKHTINEFPFFTFLFADMHPHMMVMPFSLLVLGLCVALARMQHSTLWHLALNPSRFPFPRLLRTLVVFPSWSYTMILVLLGLLAGALHATNTWDYPTFVGLAILTLVLIHYQSLRSWGRRREIAQDTPASGELRPTTNPIVHHIVSLVVSVGIVVGIGKLLFLPFTSHFATKSSGIEFLPPDVVRTTATELLRLHGTWLFLMASGGIAIAYRWLQFRLWQLFVFAGLVGAFLWVGIRLGYTYAPLLLLPLLGGAGWLLWSARNLHPRLLLPILWGSMALAILLGVEVVVVRGDVARMNTVFKFGLHAWVLFALTAAVALPWLMREYGQRTLPTSTKGFLQGIHWIWRVVAGVLLLAMFVYPMTATPARIADRFQKGLPWSLDGLAFMKHVSHRERGKEFPLREDYEAIQWLQQHISGTSIILEAQDVQYHWASRIATYTGLPTLLGWEWHQIQQRMVVNADAVIQSRKRNIITIYSTPDPSQALELIRNYGIEYLYVGGVERAYYPAEGLAKFDTLVQQGALARVFETGATVIYQVLHPAFPRILTTSISVKPPHLRMAPPLRLLVPVNALPVIDEFAWNRWVGNHSGKAVLVWLVAWYGLALLGLPLAILVFGEWADGGVVWARLIGLILLGYATWLPTSLRIWHYSLAGVSGGIVLVLLLNMVLVRWAGGIPAIRTTLWQRRRHILMSEAIFLLGFMGFVGLRSLNPDLWHPVWGGEKPMEFGFLNAILRSPVMPPYTPFFSDGYINYYYYGIYLVSVPIKMTGIPPAIAFNLVIPTLFALTMTGAYAIALQLTGMIRYGLLGSFLVTIAGNLAGVVKAGWSQGISPVLHALGVHDQLHAMTIWERLGTLGMRLGDWYIGPSRVITRPSFTINEFPFWSFLFGDLHPHLIALPITLLSIALGYQILKGNVNWSVQHNITSPHARKSYSVWLLVALTLGTLATTNSWDFPPHVMLITIALFGAAWRTRPEPVSPHPPNDPTEHAGSGLGWRLVGAGGLAITLTIAALSLYMPFFDHYHAFVSGIGLVRDGGSHILDYLVIYGVFAAILVPLTIGSIVRWLLWMGWAPRRRRIIRYVPEHRAKPQPLPPPLHGLTVPSTILLLRSLLLVIVFPVAPSLIKQKLRHLWYRPKAKDGGNPPILPVTMVRRVTVVRNSSCVEQIVSVISLVVLTGVLMALTVVAIVWPVGSLRFWLGLLLFLVAGVLFVRDTTTATWYTLLLAAMGYALSLATEVVFVRDHLAGGEHYRMNTVFKFGMQIWVFLAIAAAAGFPLLLGGLYRVGRKIARAMQSREKDRLPSHRRAQHLGGRVMQGIGGLGLSILLLMALVFPLVGTPSRLANRFPRAPAPTLNGLAFLEQAEFTYEGKTIDLRPDGQAIAWLNANIVGTPIVVQSGLWFYRTYGIRVAANTGLPTIVSALHESEQRDPTAVGRRDEDVETLYRTPDPNIARNILLRYRVNYVYVGSVERAFYPPEGIRKFQEMPGELTPIYQTATVQIYKVRAVQSPYPEPTPYLPGEAIEPLPSPSVPATPSLFPADLRELEELVASDPRNNLNAIELAQRYRKMERFEDAIRVLEEAAKYHPEDIFLHHVWGDILAHIGQYDRAKEVYEFAARSRPTSFNWYKVGSELLRWGRLDEAELYLIKAMTTDPVEPATYFALGVLYQQQGKREQAEKQFSLYLQAAPEGPYRAEAEQRLRGE